MSSLIQSALLMSLLAMAACSSYSGYKVIRIFSGYKRIHSILSKFDGVQVLKSTYKIVDVAVNPRDLHEFIHDLKRYDLKYTISSHNLQNDVDKENSGKSCKDFQFDKYNTFDDIEKHLLSIKGRYGSIKMDRTILGTTYEGRKIYLIKVYNEKKCKYGEKRAILLEGGIHGREWLSHAYPLYFLDFLLHNKQGNHLVDKFDWYIIPVLNPDGYVWTMADGGDRLWRKNRSPQANGCFGVDLNRNFDIMWDPNNGGSSDPCNQRFSGPEPFSEIESRVERDLMKDVEFHAFLGLHTFGQMMIYPNGFSNETLPDKDKIDECARVFAETATATNGEVYTFGQITDFFTTISGLPVDYARVKNAIKYAYEIELRDTETHELPADEIIPASKETTAAIIEWSKCILGGDDDNYGYPYN